eukprot:TRINITY_DN23225_c0_g1_i1.p1 TRINITY_DN23225_c0_g1~~TRINITY_DN23225_c0_g1_i1.p1  ORF type:complete len:215 (-),score=68.15 TRINITY_DN23225_c0_g1_i1:581-1225(-)
MDEPRRQEEEDDDDDETGPGDEGGVEDDDDEKVYNPGEKVALKDQLEMDKDDESLRRWKEQLLANANLAGSEGMLPEVAFKTLRIVVEGRPDIQLPIPEPGANTSDKAFFVLKEKSKYKLQFEFSVKNELVVGLTYVNKVWRLGRQVDKTKLMLGVYAPQVEPYVFTTEEETTPHGMLARGHYTAKTVFSDDDGKVYLVYDYKFDIKKDWESSD